MSAICDRAIDRAQSPCTRRLARSLLGDDQRISTVQLAHCAPDAWHASDQDLYDCAPCTYYVRSPTVDGRGPYTKGRTPTMSNGRSFQPHRRDPVGKLLGPLDGGHIPGGCDHCDSGQTTPPLEANIWRITVHHDSWCPWLAERRPP
jgi:hypothetical protein